MIAAIHQPNYLPSLQFFNKIRSCDVFILLDDAQFTRNSFINRNRIRTVKGPLWLTVPVKQKFGQRIRDVEIDNSQPWARKHWRSIKQNYQGTKGFITHAIPLEGICLKKWDKLLALNLTLIDYLRIAFGVTTQLRFASELAVTTQGTQRLIDICQKVDADTYLSGSGGRNYQDEEQFEKAGIRLQYQDAGSGPSLSAIDDLLKR